MDTTNELEVLKTENRRLRKILAGIAEAGLGQGALVEVYTDRETMAIALCRADVDEETFAGQVSEAIGVLVETIGMQIVEGRNRRLGVTASDAATAGDAPREE